ncbi:MAG: hypothetical protein EAZ89_19780 [Bacteroidetes bacterium]|nr:MAG: hypothetical protein EAZ89_19780 [Bacteroidota bacterium]
MQNFQPGSADPSHWLPTQNILHKALILGVALFYGAAWFINSRGGAFIPGEETMAVLWPVFLAIAAICLLVSYYLGRTLTAQIPADIPLMDRLTRFRSVKLMQWALLDAPALMMGIGFLLTGNTRFLMLGGAILLYFLNDHPTADKTAQALDLDEDDQRQLEGE